MPIILRIATGLISVAPSIGKYLMKELGLKQVSKTVAKNAKNIKKINPSQARNLVKKDKQLGPVIKKQDPSESAIQKATIKKFEPKTAKKVKKITPPKLSSKKGKKITPQKPASPTKEYLKKQGFKKSSGNVPVKRAGSSLTAPQKMKLSGLKKKGRLRDTIVPLTVGTIAASQLGGGPKSGESKTVRKKKRKPVVGGSSSSTSNINLQGGQGGLGTGTQGSGKLNTSNINLQGGQGGLGTGTQGSRESLSKQEKAFADSRGGLKAFAPGKIEKGLATLGGGKMRDAYTSVKDTFYSDIKDRMLEDGGEVSEYEENYVKNFRKGGKVGKKKGGMVKRSYGGKVKRNMGGMVSPRKKAVFRRGGGKALRGFGNATYSNKMY